ncbi:hypothetical protein [Myroides odoratus]|uniref:hypothetical protein n=1 Tax=Myroides odoratus TaxID=256 RepID=UPI0039AF99BE
MNRLFYYFGLVFIGLSVIGCKQKAASNPIDVEKSAPVDQSKITSTIEEFEPMKQDILDKLNETVKRKKLTSVEDIMRLYAPESQDSEGKYTYDITVLQMSNSSLTIVTLVEDGLNDDSMKAKKIVMTLKMKEGHYQVTQIKQSYQCWEGRGHTNWNSAPCT